VAQAVNRELVAAGIEDDPLFPALQAAKPRQIRTLTPSILSLLLTESISPLPLHKVLVLLEYLERYRDDRYYDHQRLALAKALAFSVSNLHFGPEVGIGPIKMDAPVIAPWLQNIQTMASDLRQVRSMADTPAIVYHADARCLSELLEPNSVDAVITSPPYPNEKDYTRTTRLEAVILGFIRSKSDLRALKRNLIRSNTRNVYHDDDDDKWIAENTEIQQIAEEIERRRIALGKRSGFERLYSRVTKLYFGGMARHLADLRHILRPGSYLAYVVGDQASYLRVLIRTGRILASIAESLGYKVVSIDLFHTRLATATREQLREEVVVLQWPGKA
jgi:hypothetical protein